MEPTPAQPPADTTASVTSASSDDITIFDASGRLAAHSHTSEASSAEDMPSKKANTATPHDAAASSADDASEHDSDSDPDRRRAASRASTAASHSRPDMSLGHEVLFVALVCCAQLFTQAGLGQAIPVLSYISTTFGGMAAGERSWVAAAFSLTAGTFIVIAGRLSDMYGHKSLFIVGWAWTAFWSLLAGLSALTHQQIFFDVCRAMQGLGSAILLPCSLAILGTTYPAGRRKNLIFCIYGATAPNGFLLGSVFTSLLAQFAWWPWAYWIEAMLCVVLAVLAVFVVPGVADNTSSLGPQHFDFLGAATGVAGLVLFNVAWNQAPTVGWQEPYVIALLILGAAMIAVFVVVEHRVQQPLIPVQGLSASVGFVLGCIALGWSSFGVWVYYFWQFLEVLRGQTPLLSTAQLAPAGVAGIVAALTTGRLLGIIRPEIIMLIALCFFCLGNTLLATMSVDQTYWASTFVATVLTPFGMDMSFPAATLILSNSVPRRHQGIAASLVTTVVNYSISIGLGIGGTVESYLERGGSDTLSGYRGALYAGIGLSGSGIVLAVIFVAYMASTRKRAQQQGPEQEQEQLPKSQPGDTNDENSEKLRHEEA